MSESGGISESFEDLYETASCGFVSFLNDGLIIKINQTLLTWLGLERASVVSTLKFQDLIGVGEQIFFETQFSPLLQMQGIAEEIHFNLLNRNRARLPVLTSTKQILVSENKTAVNRMTIFNISDRKRFEIELKLERKKAEATAKAKADFLSMLSHEIRTSLNAIIGVSNLLDSTKLTAEQEPFMEMLKSSSDNLMNLLNSILDLSKLEAGKVHLEKREFRPRKIVEGNALAWQGLALKKGISVDAEIDASIPSSAIGDPIKITQILSNLIGNAIKFTESGRILVRAKLVTLEQRDMILRFEVEDSGIGIAPDKLTAIFEEFNQAELDTSIKFGGTGLGLAISQKLANLFGSRILVQSQLGVGSIFSFEMKLPIGNPSADTHGIERVSNQLDALKGLSVLIADDSQDSQVLLKHLFKKWGAHADCVSDGRQAVERVQTHHYDVVLMDLRMPIMNGYDAAVMIRNLSETAKSQIPIIAFSGSTTFEGHDLASNPVFSVVMGKPFKPLDLVAKLLPYTNA